MKKFASEHKLHLSKVAQVPASAPAMHVVAMDKMEARQEQQDEFLQDILALMCGYKWSGGSITYAFPDHPNDYRDEYEPDAKFVHPLSFKMEQIARYVLEGWSPHEGMTSFSVGAVESLTNLSIRYAGRNQGTIQIGRMDKEDMPVKDTPFGRFPIVGYTSLPGTGTTSGNVMLTEANAEDFLHPSDFGLVIHELGHALGLKHPHDLPERGSFPVMSEAHDSSEFTIMSYRGLAMPQTFMQYDVAALQMMYGPNYSHNATDTVYRWAGFGETFINDVAQGGFGSPAILQTIWDGGGNDTYDFSDSFINQQINLMPGYYSAFTAREPGASGNVYNAFQWQGDDRSLIENAIAGEGGDTIIGNRAANKLWGNNGNDTIQADIGNDTLYGGAGNDLLYEGYDMDGRNKLYGEAGIDYLYGGGGDDKLDGGRDNDRLWGGAGNDRLYGGSGGDLLFGQDGSDAVYGGDGDDRLQEEESDLGDDVLSGEAGNDDITGGAGNDSVYGGEGHDWVRGGSGHDFVSGGPGNDRVFGHDGDDVITGGDGADFLVGNAGYDAFLFEAVLNGADIDSISDFSAADDRILLDHHVFRACSGMGDQGKRLVSEQFWIGTQAHDASDRIIYDPALGRLLYDPDGTGSAAAIAFADLYPNLSLASGHFVVV